MSHAVTVFLFTFGLFLAMLLFLELGRRIGIRRVKEDSQAASEGVGAVDAAVFALLGLLLLRPNSPERFRDLTRGGS